MQHTHTHMHASTYAYIYTRALQSAERAPNGASMSTQSSSTCAWGSGQPFWGSPRYLEPAYSLVLEKESDIYPWAIRLVILRAWLSSWVWACIMSRICVLCDTHTLACQHVKHVWYLMVSMHVCVWQEKGKLWLSKCRCMYTEYIYIHIHMESCYFLKQSQGSEILMGVYFAGISWVMKLWLWQ
jgi:hypothetical protein